MTTIEQAVRAANAPDKWDALWADPAQEQWRAKALGKVYKRISQLLPRGAMVTDLGGGTGALAKVLRDSKGCDVLVVDHSQVALHEASKAGFRTARVDLNEWSPPDANWFVATEAVEHLSRHAMRSVLLRAEQSCGLLVSVPDNRLDHDEEPQHSRSWTAVEFLEELRWHFEHVRVEVIDGYLLGVCGKLAAKPFRLSVCLPARDEEEGLGAVLASFRGVADELVVGVDHRTTDSTRKVAAAYADIVFDIADPLGPPDDGVPPTGVHFAHMRNRCIDYCTGDWIFMTEAHERLAEGQDVLLALNQVVPEQARVAFVTRSGNHQQWAFPWLFRNAPDIRFKRPTHNVLDYPDKTYCVHLPQVRTLHERGHGVERRRAEQRKAQNRSTLMRDWLETGNANSLHYLGAEWREHDPAKAIERMREFLALGNRNGAQRYHVRMMLAKELLRAGRRGECREVLMGCVADDWTRTEHWLWLGDMAFEDEEMEQALQLYRYAATTIRRPPMTLWWIEMSHYLWLPAQRLAMCCAALGLGEEALHWARQVVDLLPEDAPQAAVDEARANIEQLERALDDEASD